MAGKKKTIDFEEAREQVAKVCRRLALLHLAFTQTLEDEFGSEKAKLLTLKAIKNYGQMIGDEIKAKVSVEGLENTPENYKEDLPKFGMHDRWETVEVDGEKRIRMYGCVMGQVWKKLGADKPGRLYCYIDPAKYMAYNPDYKLIHTKAMTDGDEYCEFAIRPTTDQEKKDFARNRDWTYLDK